MVDIPKRGVAHIDELRPAEYNPRKIDKRAAEGLLASLRRFGLVQDVVVNRRTVGKGWPKGAHSTIVGGHQRVAALQVDGAKEIPVTWVDLSEADERALNIALNNPHISGTFTADVVEIVRDVSTANYGLAKSLRLDALLPAAARFGLNPEEEESEATGDAPLSVRGEAYALGAHTLVCGDCTDRSTWVDGALCLTDPPYGVGLNYDEHDDTESALRELASAWLPLARDACANVVFTPGITRMWMYPEPDWVLCWFYGASPNRSSWGFNTWQPALCYGKDPSLSKGKGARPDGVNMNVSGEKGLAHPCPKPLAFWRWLMERCSFSDDDLIVDPFAGSGTTLIAAETHNRRAHLIELSPRYCDLIRRRWGRWARAHDVDPGPGAL